MANQIILINQYHGSFALEGLVKLFFNYEENPLIFSRDEKVY